MQLAALLLTLLVDTVRYLCLRPSSALAAENLFLRKQLALYQERHVKPKRACNMTRFTLTWLARWFNWKSALVIVKPETLIRHRLPDHQSVGARPILGGVHHEYQLEKKAA